MTSKEISITAWLQLIFLAIIWGSSFILIKKCLTGLTPIQVASFRVGIACIASIPFIIIYRDKIDWSLWPKFVLVGLATTGIPSFCFALAQTKVISSTAGILNSLTPIFTLIVGILAFKQKFEWKKALGVIVGFSGAALLVWSTSQGNNGATTNIWYSLLILLATICYGINGNAVKAFFQNTNSIVVSSVAFFLVGLPIVLYLVIHGDLVSVISNPSKHLALGAVTLLSLMCTVLANIVFYNLVQNTSVLFGSSVTFLIPIVAVLWGMADDEVLGIYHIIAIACIFLAIFILRRK